MKDRRTDYIDDDYAVTVDADPLTALDVCEDDLDREFIELERKIREAKLTDCPSAVA